MSACSNCKLMGGEYGRTLIVKFYRDQSVHPGTSLFDQ